MELAAVGRLSKSKVREDFDCLFLLFDTGFHQIFDGYHSNQFPVIDER